jgi:hypothetical protein
MLLFYTFYTKLNMHKSSRSMEKPYLCRLVGTRHERLPHAPSMTPARAPIRLPASASASGRPSGSSRKAFAAHHEGLRGKKTTALVFKNDCALFPFRTRSFPKGDESARDRLRAERKALRQTVGRRADEVIRARLPPASHHCHVAPTALRRKRG